LEGETYVDVNIFVYWLVGDRNFGPRARTWIKRMEKSRGFVTSALSVYEAASVIAVLTDGKMKDPGFIERVVQPITDLPGLSTIPLERQHLIDARKHMVDYSLDYEDALHLASALDRGTSSIVSNDKHFDKTPLQRVF
jgi:predicted nucleic acid-binding protein